MPLIMRLAGAVCWDGLDDAGKVEAEDERRETPALLSIIVLMFALSVEDVGVLRTAVCNADQVLMGLWRGCNDLCRHEVGRIVG